MWSEKEMNTRFGFIVEAVINFFQWTPNWLLAIIAFPCWISAVITITTMSEDTSGLQFLVFGAGPAMVGVICGMALMVKSEKR